jgi:hypothetical protein
MIQELLSFEIDGLEVTADVQGLTMASIGQLPHPVTNAIRTLLTFEST